MSESSTRILIADDHTIFRDGLKMLLSGWPDFEVVGEAGDGDEVLHMVERLHPDVLLLDLFMPKKSGMKVLEELKELNTGVRAIVLSDAVEEKDIPTVFELGARGIVLKDSSADTLCKCVKAVLAGQYWLGRKIISKPPSKFREGGSNNDKSASYGLTPREMEIIRAVVSGGSNKAIARKFGISEQTVKHHITNIFDKLGVYNRLELVLFSFHHGLVKEE